MLRASRRPWPSASCWKLCDTWSCRPPRSTQAPRPAAEYLAPTTPVSESVAPHPVAECTSPALAVFTTPTAVIKYVARVPVTECVIPSPAVTYTTADTTGVNLEITDFMEQTAVGKTGQNIAVEPIVDVHVPSEMAKVIRLPVQQIVGEIVDVPRLVPQERFQQNAVHHVGHIPVPPGSCSNYPT